MALLFLLLNVVGVAIQCASMPFLVSGLLMSDSAGGLAIFAAAQTQDLTLVLLESLVGGVIIGLCVAYLLVRFPDRIPPSNPALKALTLSLVALIAVTLLVEAPTKLLATSQDPLRYFLTATAFNVLRLLALGAVVGACNSRLVSRDRADAAGHRQQNPASDRRGLGNRRYGSDSGLRGVTPHGGPRSSEGQTMDAGQPGARQRNTRGADGDHAQG